MSSLSWLSLSSNLTAMDIILLHHLLSDIIHFPILSRHSQVVFMMSYLFPWYIKKVVNIGGAIHVLKKVITVIIVILTN